MSTLLRLDLAHRLFYGANELSAVIRNGVQLWPWTPQRLAGAGVTLAWWDVNRLDTLFQERTSGGTTPAVVNGVVGTIRDLSGGGRHMVAPSDAARPILRQDDWRYYLELDGVDDTLSAPIITAGVPAYPLFMGSTQQKRANSSTAALHGLFRDANNYAGFTDGSTVLRVNAIHRMGGVQVSLLGASGSYTVDTTTAAAVTFTDGQIQLWINNRAPVSVSGAVNPALLASGNYFFNVFRLPATGRRFSGGFYAGGKTPTSDEVSNSMKWLGRVGGLAV